MFLLNISGFQSVSFMRPFVLQFVASLAVLCLSTLSHKRDKFQKKKFVPYNVVLIFSKILTEIFRILRLTQRDMIVNVCLSLCYSCQILIQLDFLHRFSINP